MCVLLRSTLFLSLLTFTLVAGPDAKDFQEGSSDFPNKRPRVQSDAQQARVAQKREERIRIRRQNALDNMTEEQKEERARRLWSYVFQMTSMDGGGEGQSNAATPGAVMPILTCLTR